LLLWTAVVLITAAPALAKGGSPFDRASARPGDAVSLGVSDIIGENWPVHAAVDVYLVPLAASPRWWTIYNAYGPTYGPRPHLAASVRLGSIVRLDGVTQHLRVRVPHVAPGRYVLGYFVAATRSRWTSALPNYQVGSNAVLRVRR
jgi:hypothetical protein